LSHGWKPNNIVYLKVSWYHTVVTFPHFWFRLADQGPKRRTREGGVNVSW
jgi:hypothetical protein